MKKTFVSLICIIVVKTFVLSGIPANAEMKTDHKGTKREDRLVLKNIKREKSDFRTVSREEINRIVKRFLDKKAKETGMKMEIRSIRFRGNVVVPKSKDITSEVVPYQNINYMGSTPLHLIFKERGRTVRKVKIIADLDRRVPVILSARPIERGEIISEQDLYTEERRITELPNRVVWNMKEVVGKRAKRYIRMSTLIKRNLFEYPPVIKKGDFVTILAESGSLKITTKGEAVDDGSEGDTIKIRNLKSKRIVAGTVLSENIVKVEF